LPVDRLNREVLVITLNLFWKQLSPIQSLYQIQDNFVIHRVAVFQPIMLVDDYTIEMAPV
jgi:hypothetical protein